MPHRKQYNWTLPKAIEKRLGEHGHGHQRAIAEEGHVLIVLHEPPGADDRERDERVFLRFPDGKLQCNGRENGELQLNRLLQDYQTAFEQFDESCQTAKMSSELFDLIEQLIPMSRAANNLSQALQAARECVHGDSFLIAKRDEANAISRNMEILLHAAKLSLDFRVARSSETQAEKSKELAAAQHKLNILAAITFPILSIATLFGMGLTHGLEDKSPFIFWSIFVMGIGLGSLTIRWVTK